MFRWNQIQRLLSPVSPSGMRLIDAPSARQTVRNTVSESGNGMLPTKCTVRLFGMIHHLPDQLRLRRP